MKKFFCFLTHVVAVASFVWSFQCALAEEYRPLHQVAPNLYTMPATKLDIALMKMEGSVEHATVNIHKILEDKEEGYGRFSHGVITSSDHRIKIYINSLVRKPQHVTKSNCLRFLEFVPLYIRFLREETSHLERLISFKSYFFHGQISHENSQNPDSIEQELENLMKQTFLEVKLSSMSSSTGKLTNQACQLELNTFKISFHDRPF